MACPAFQYFVDEEAPYELLHLPGSTRLFLADGDDARIAEVGEEEDRRVLYHRYEHVSNAESSRSDVAFVYLEQRLNQASELLAPSKPARAAGSDLCASA